MVAVTELWVHKFCKFGSFSDSMNIMQMELLNEQHLLYHEILSKNILNANVNQKMLLEVMTIITNTMPLTSQR